MKHHQPGRLLHVVLDRYLLAPIAVLIALVWANTAAESYFTVSIRTSYVVNEIGMALFIGLVMQEVVDATQPGGALHTWRKWSLPLMAAGGGIVGAALTYQAFVALKYETVLLGGWPVVTAIDIAAGYFLLKLLFPRTSAAYPFLLLTAVATNAFTLTVLGFTHQAAHAATWAIGLVVLAAGGAFWLRQRGVRVFWPYLAVCAPISWAGLAWSGMHPALALVPIVPFLPHRPRGIAFLEDVRPADHVRLIEHEWAFVVQPVILLFGLVNGGVVLTSYDTGTWAVLTGAIVGRPVGILCAVAVAVALGWHLPARIGWREVAVIAMTTSSGFTLALFAATAVYPIGPLLAEAKLGALLTASGAIVALLLARMLRVGVFAGHRPALHHPGRTHLRRVSA